MAAAQYEIIGGAVELQEVSPDNPSSIYFAEFQAKFYMHRARTNTLKNLHGAIPVSSESTQIFSREVNRSQTADTRKMCIL